MAQAAWRLGLGTSGRWGSGPETACCGDKDDRVRSLGTGLGSGGVSS